MESEIIRERVTGQSRGFGFVKFATEEQAAAAIHQLHNYSLAGKRLVVRLKHGARGAGLGGPLPPPPPLPFGAELPPHDGGELPLPPPPAGVPGVCAAATAAAGSVVRLCAWPACQGGTA